VRISSLAVRITAWYDWLLIILILVFGAYTCKCLDYFLSVGVQNALSIRAREIATMFAASGQIPGHPQSTGLGWNDQFIAAQQRVDLVSDFYRKPGTDIVFSARASHEPKPANVVREAVRGAGFLIARAPSTFNNEKFIVEVEASEKPIKAVFRQAAFALVIGLVIGLALATWGSVFLVKCALAPVHRIAQSVQALPVAHPEERIRAIAVREQMESLFETVNEMVSKLEVSFQIGMGLPAEAFPALSTRLGRVRKDLAESLESEGRSAGVAATLLSLLKETERLSDLARNLAMPSDEDPGQGRMERLRFYLGGLAVAGREHVCVLIEKFGADLASEARDPSGGKFPVRW
jgi:hypothetical protein